MRGAEVHSAAEAPAEPAAGGLLVTNLLNDLDSLGWLLARAAAKQSWLDAFLLVAGMNQIAEDQLHDAPYPFDAAASLLRKAALPQLRLIGRIVAASALALRRLAAFRGSVRRTLAWQQRVAGLADELAGVVMGESSASTNLPRRCRLLVSEIQSLPVEMRRAVVRLPACFHSFDQRPEDLHRLVERFVERYPESERPLLVVGLRTSGSYLAPMIAAALRARGRRAAHAMTIRPGRILLGHERAIVRSLIGAGAHVLLTDDPPVTGGSLAEVAAQLERLGVARTRLVVMIATDGRSAGLPPALAGYEAVVLPWREWNVHVRLAREAVAGAVAELLQGQVEVHAVEELTLPDSDRRHVHRRARFRVLGVDGANGGPCTLEVLASGVGVGYLGASELAVAQGLDKFAPRTLGLRDGVLYREWIPAGRQLRADAAALPAAAASYVAARRDALAVVRDASVAMRGQRPVWEVAGLVLARGFGRAAPVARTAFVDRAARRLLRTGRPSVLDGNTAPEHWFAGEDAASALKVGLSSRTYWSLGLACFDGAFDLAGVGALATVPGLPQRMQAAWSAETGEEVDRERWLLYELAHLWGYARDDPSHEVEVRRASARAAARYFAAAFLADLTPSSEGALCALDIDGVLETEHLGFPAMSRASAGALRALIAHGYRPVFVTGRGLREVQERCQAYGLPAGVAEYGSALCLDGGERVISLVGQRGVDALRQTRGALLALEDVRLDPAYVHAVRAYRVAPDGRRRPLDAGEVTQCLAAAGLGPGVLAIPGDSQTDFVAAGIDKGSGLRALASELGGDGGSAAKVALAVGDSAADAAMLALASRAFVPAHAAPAAASTGAERLRHSYQAGLAEAVGRLLGHEPGGCPRCHAPMPADGRSLLLDLLSIAEDGSLGIARGTARLAWRLR